MWSLRLVMLMLRMQLAALAFPMDPAQGDHHQRATFEFDSPTIQAFTNQENNTQVRL